MRVGVGSLIWVDTDEPQPDGAMEVVAVFEDFPDNSLLGECEVVKNLGETNLYTTSEWSFNYFVKFRPGADPDEFARQWTNVNQEMQSEAAGKRAAAGDAAAVDGETGSSWVMPISSWQVGSTLGTRNLWMVRRLLVFASPSVSGDASASVTFLFG